MKTVMETSTRAVVDVWKEKNASVVPTAVKDVSVVLGGSLEDVPRHDQDSLSFVGIRQTP